MFAYVDMSISDGVNVDELGNLCAGCGDSVHVVFTYISYHTPVPYTQISANFVLVDDDSLNTSGKGGYGGCMLVILVETNVYLVRLAIRGVELDL